MGVGGPGAFVVEVVGQAPNYTSGLQLVRDPHFVGGLAVDVMGWTGPVGQGTTPYKASGTFPGEHRSTIVVVGSDKRVTVPVKEIPGEQSDAFLKETGGAKFWAYISPQNNTAEAVTSWRVVLQQQGGNWQGEITSQNPHQILATPGLSGVFNVTVTASGPGFPETTLTPQPDSKPDVGCNANCHAMIGIVATPDGKGANYWTVWDAFC
jgi:hypothetical protein